MEVDKDLFIKDFFFQPNLKLDICICIYIIPQSSGLNPIQSVWDVLKRVLCNSWTLRSIQHLSEKHQMEINLVTLQKLLETMKRMCPRIKAKGGPTKY